MTSEKDLELVDQYLSNRMGAQDKAAFEQRLKTDVDLRNEVSLQHKVVESIRKTRVTELKKMLNDIPVSSIPSDGASLATRIGVWAIATALVGTGLYLYINRQQETTIQPAPTEEIIDEPVITEPEKITEPTEENTDKPAAKKGTSQDVIVKKPEDGTPVEKKVQEEPVSPATRDVFDPSEESSKEGEAETARGKSNEAVAPSILVETVTDKKYNFHYQFKDDKLYLYGSFEKNLYEIMEFFSGNKRTMFLFYKDNYYLLNEEDQKVKALAPIKDQALLEKLKDYRKN